MLTSLRYSPLGAWLAGRDSRWPRLAKHHLKLYPRCELCKGTKDVVPHHVKPFYLFPELELDPGNLITLCDANQCHLLVGHGRDWRAWNPNVYEDILYLRGMIGNRQYIRGIV